LTFHCGIIFSGDKTNNRVEGDNNRMKKYHQSSKPNITTAVNNLRLFEALACNKYENAKKMGAKQPNQAKHDFQKDVEFNKVKKLYNLEKLNLKDYWSSRCLQI
jgi:hypothetical protein